MRIPDDVEDLPSSVRAIVTRLGTPAGEEPDLQPMHDALAAIPGVDASDAPTYRFMEYEVRTGLGKHLKTEAELLDRLRKLDIAAAPEAVALLATAEGYVLVRRYWACPGERLLPVRTTPGAFREEARNRLRRDLQVLADQGLIHPYAREYFHWRISSETGTLVLDSWYALRSASPGECAEHLENIDRLLSMRAD